MKIVNLIKFLFLCLAAAILVIIAFDTSYTRESNNLEITFLDVGQGDCAYIKTPDNFRLLIDSGDKGTYKNYLKPFMGSRRINSIDAAVVTHFDSDHFYGLYEMFGKKRVDKVYVPYGAHYNYLTDILYESCLYHDIDYESIKMGDIIYEGKDGVKIWALFPNNLIYDNRENITQNNDSIVIMLEYKDKKFLFMGDIENDAEIALIKYMDLKADVLKVGHHGSETSTSKFFINEVRPKYSVISCGYENKFDLPDITVIDRLETFGSKVYRTDLDGDITFLVDEEGELSVKTAKQGD